MKIWLTEIKAICPIRNELITWCGPNVEAFTHSLAQEYCYTSGLGYCKVVGELISEIPCKDGTHEADFSKIVNYDDNQLN
jgi:hypothetical protein